MRRHARYQLLLVFISVAADTQLDVGRRLAQQAGSAGGVGAQREVCSDICSLARNGVCEEGRPGPGAPAEGGGTRGVYCDLGEDPKVPGPIRYLRSKDVQVNVKAAAVPTDAAFTFAFTDHSKDFDVSYHVEHYGVIEPYITQIFYRILKDRCVRPDGSRALVVDVGANFGWFAILAARLGCRVIAYEPVPLFRWFLEYSAYINGLRERIEVRASAVGHEAGAMRRIVVPSTGVWGAAGINGLSLDASLEGQSREEVEVASVRLEDEVKEDVLMMKVDVEGWEWAVVAGAAGLLRGQHVEHLLLDYTPGAFERRRLWDEMAATPRMLVDLIHLYGFRVGSVGDGAAGFSGWEAPLQPAREVTLDSLKYDIEDVRRWKNGTLGCPLAPELAPFLAWRRCVTVPEDFNARSFRSEFTHSVNMWAARGPSAELLALQGTVGVVSPDAPPQQYYANNSRGVGMGGRPCDKLGLYDQVRHRCPCQVLTACAAEEAALERLLAEGRVPPAYVLGDAAKELGLA
ncbi:hypothetical protein HYH03_004398 [Edaphochlamys debaryana]|uniref:Methyltransferase FkbM domain-containing protein n=1 Tax=Edaphochlamys debaryana TaxID=47281 RepID=A0A835YHD2_9CHLO|nr:hypothetical protein HYH03_004398 [Edaphochlamys debaryana]|eukprot:KAG2497659.1 hypothetical protein HYH03_004398 [Edaphochlamys debaryana]